MSATSRVHFAAVYVRAGKLTIYPPQGLNESIGEATLTGDKVDAGGEIVVPAGSTVDLYNWGRDGDFALLGAVNASGALYIGIGTDKATSSTDDNPSGLAEMWQWIPKSCLSPFLLDSRDTITALTANASSVYGPTTNILTDTPTLPGSGNKIAGQIYRVVLYNPGTSAITVQRILHN